MAANVSNLLSFQRIFNVREEIRFSPLPEIAFGKGRL